MGRGIEQKHRLWIKTDTERLKRENPEMTWKQLAERKNINVNTLRAIMKEDGRQIKRKEMVEI